LKEQKKYDNMVSDLADQIERILPFAKQVLEVIVYDDTELLEGAIRKLYDLIMDTAEFICDYIRRSPASRYSSMRNVLMKLMKEGITIKSIIPRDDQERIQHLQGIFSKLKEEFDRAVNIESLITTINNGNTTPL
jgi:hypothetical protein